MSARRPVADVPGHEVATKLRPVYGERREVPASIAASVPVSGIPPIFTSESPWQRKETRRIIFLFLRFSEAADELLADERRAPVGILRERPSTSRH